jgi:predicted transcriptional regulator
MNINVLKVAFLLRANRYDTSDKLISLADMEDSINLLTYTYAKSAELLLSMSSTELQKHIGRIENYLNKHGETTRRELLRVTHIPAYELSIALDHMNQEGLIITKRNKKVCSFPTKDGNETYTLNMEEEEKE